MKVRKTLCQSCRYLDRASFESGREYNLCKKYYERLKSYALSCRHYQPKNQPSLEMMYSSAWILVKEKKAGFHNPKPDFKKPNEDNISRYPKEEDR